MTTRTAKEWADSIKPMDLETAGNVEEIIQQAMDQAGDEALDEAEIQCEDMRGLLITNGDQQSASAVLCCTRRIRALKKGAK